MTNPRLQALLRKEMTRKDFLGFTALAFISLFGIAGVVSKLLSHAATPYSSNEAENGTLSGGATVATDDTASGDKAVTFGSASQLAFPVGISMGADIALFNSSDYGAAQYAVMKADGFQSVRIDITYQTSTPYYPNSSIQAALNAGLDVLVILDGYHPNETTAAEFVSFCTKVVTIYKPLGIHNYEIINEINGSINWDNASNYVNPAAYAALLKQAYSAIKTVDSGATILFSGLAVFNDANGASDGNGNYSNNLLPAEFLTLAYAAMNGNSTGYFDALAVHPYCYTENPSTTNNWGVFFNPSSDPGFYGDSVRTIMIKNGDTDKSMWVTEFGAPTGDADGYNNNVTEVEQSAEFQTALTLCQSLDYIGAFYCFNWADDQDGDFGLNTASYVAKPALSTVTSFFKSL